MRRTIPSASLLRISGKFECLRLQSPYLCTTCKSKASTVSRTTFRRASLTPIAERNISRRIWSKSQRPPQEHQDDGDNHKSMIRIRADETSKRRDTYDSHSYEPASTWDELETVGRTSNPWGEDWEGGFHFKGFSRADTLTDTLEITAAFRRAIIEVFALPQAKVSVKDAVVSIDGPDLTHGARIWTSSTGAEVVADGQVIQQIDHSLSCDSEEIGDIDAGATLKIGDASKEAFQNVRLADLIASWDPSWRHISLQNPEIRITVLKRTMQLTGIRIPDFAIASAITTGAVLDLLVSLPKPRNLSDAVGKRNNLHGFSNVNFQDRKITLLDRERTVGRWKVIEEELRKRDLPAPYQQSM